MSPIDKINLEIDQCQNTLNGLVSAREELLADAQGWLESPTCAGLWWNYSGGSINGPFFVAKHEQLDVLIVDQNKHWGTSIDDFDCYWMFQATPKEPGCQE